MNSVDQHNRGEQHSKGWQMDNSDKQNKSDDTHHHNHNHNHKHKHKHKHKDRHRHRDTDTDTDRDRDRDSRHSRRERERDREQDRDRERKHDREKDRKKKRKKEEKKKKSNKKKERDQIRRDADRSRKRSPSPSTSRARSPSRSRSHSPSTSNSSYSSHSSRSRSPSPSPSKRIAAASSSSSSASNSKLPRFSSQDRERLSSLIQSLVQADPSSSQNLLFLFFRLDSGDQVTLDSLQVQSTRDYTAQIFDLFQLERTGHRGEEGTRYRIPTLKGGSEPAFALLPHVERFLLPPKTHNGDESQAFNKEAHETHKEKENDEESRKDAEINEGKNPSDRRVIGPVMPSEAERAVWSTNQSDSQQLIIDSPRVTPVEGDTDEDVDDVGFGPRAPSSLTPAESIAYAKLAAAREKALATRAAIAAIREKKGQGDEAGQKREEWLTSLPSASSSPQAALISAITSGDERTMKNRSFIQRNRPNPSSSASASASSWADSPAERELMQIQQQMERDAQRDVEKALAETEKAEQDAHRAKKKQKHGTDAYQLEAEDLSNPNSSARAAQLANDRMMAKMNTPSAAFSSFSGSRSLSSSSSSSSPLSLLELHQRELSEKKKEQEAAKRAGTSGGKKGGRDYSQEEPYHWDKEKEMGLRRQKDDKQIRTEINSANQLASRFQ